MLARCPTTSRRQLDSASRTAPSAGRSTPTSRSSPTTSPAATSSRCGISTRASPTTWTPATQPSGIVSLTYGDSRSTTSRAQRPGDAGRDRRRLVPSVRHGGCGRATRPTRLLPGSLAADQPPDDQRRRPHGEREAPVRSTATRRRSSSASATSSSRASAWRTTVTATARPSCSAATTSSRIVLSSNCLAARSAVTSTASTTSRSCRTSRLRLLHAEPVSAATGRPRRQCPIPNSTGLSRCQYDFRIASNDPNADIYSGKVDPDLKPFTQTEFTAGLEREIARNACSSASATRASTSTTPSRTRASRRRGSARRTSSATPVGPARDRQPRQFGYAKTPRGASASTTPSRRASTVASRNNFGAAWRTLSASSRATTRVSRARTRTAASSPGVNRFFDLPHLGFTAAGAPDNGRLATDRPHVFNASGTYMLNWGAFSAYQLRRRSRRSSRARRRPASTRCTRRLCSSVVERHGPHGDVHAAPT